MNYELLVAVIGAIWVGSEIVLAALRHSRRGESERHDRLSIILLWIFITASVFLAAVLRGVRAAHMRGGATTFLIGVALIVLGLAIRWTAVVTLWRYFTVDVSIRRDHRVIHHGIYRIIRHPAYLGSLISFIGLGVTFMNWLSLAAIVIGTLIVFSYRIAVEERALVTALGDEYRAYAARTKRLIPGVY
ncbi:MAG TPA: isoprenylcysteine carboxylmethyltransferase family protein [Thermoanaerobaculia bacterium]|jgi:protein-S-isoprenylcysteine O-methyltransferase Ste14|nr:isoprenylcysteine carboxylmethyltransferase family protein [Thermoanaerobaculia bacterium]